MRLLILVLVLFLSLNLFSSEKLFKRADSLFELHEIENAISVYEEIIEKNMESSELYYNIGICYFQIEDFEKSKSYFQKSIILNPKLKIAKDRISQCNVKLYKKEHPKLFYIIWKNKIISLFSKNFSIIISLISIILVFLLVLFNVFKTRKIQKRYITLLFLISLFFHLVSFLKIEQEKVILVKNNIELKNSNLII
tara:strand:- start:212 stop:799 length:588 start_codon:yes stop_codon:yes gene_type:complete